MTLRGGEGFNPFTDPFIANTREASLPTYSWLKKKVSPIRTGWDGMVNRSLACKSIENPALHLSFCFVRKPAKILSIRSAARNGFAVGMYNGEETVVGYQLFIPLF